MEKAASRVPGRVRELARLQAGAVSRRQALSAGMSADAVKWAVRRGTWQQVYWGVYSTHSGQPARPTRLWAAVLYPGPGAVLTGRQPRSTA